jgi:hypothetical protein
MSSQRKALDLKKLKEKAMYKYSPQAVMQQTLDLLNFSSCASASDSSCASQSVPFLSSPPHFLL